MPDNFTLRWLNRLFEVEKRVVALEKTLTYAVPPHATGGGGGGNDVGPSASGGGGYQPRGNSDSSNPPSGGSAIKRPQAPNDNEVEKFRALIKEVIVAMERYDNPNGALSFTGWYDRARKALGE